MVNRSHRFRFLAGFILAAWGAATLAVPLASARAQSANALPTTYGPWAASITTMHIAAWDSGMVFLGTENDGVYRRVQEGPWARCGAGFRWSSRPDPANLEPLGRNAATAVRRNRVNVFGTRPDAPGVLWVGTRDHGLLVSRDRGATLVPVAGLPDTISIEELALPSDVPGLVMLRTGKSRAYVSTDLGQTWADPFDGRPVSAIASLPGPGPCLIAAVRGESFSMDLLVSGDGIDWKMRVENTPAIRQLIPDAARADLLFAVQVGYGMPSMSGYPVDVSRDGGRTWGGLTVPLDPSPAVVAPNPDGGWYVVNDDSLRVLNRSGSTLRTLPLHVTGPLLQPEDLRGVLDAGQGSIYVWTRQGLLHSTDGGNTAVWDERGLGNASIGRVAIDPRNSNHLLAAGASGLFGTWDRGASWARLGSGAWNDLTFAPSDPSIVYAGSENGLWRSEDGGRSWTVSQSLRDSTMTGLPGDPFSGLRSVAVDPINPNTLYCVMQVPHRNLFHSTDGGTRWERLIEIHMSDWGNPLVIDPQSRGTIYAVGGEVHVSVQDGINWHTARLHPRDRKNEPKVTGVYAGWPGYTKAVLATNQGYFWFNPELREWSRFENQPNVRFERLGELHPFPPNGKTVLSVVLGWGVLRYDGATNQWFRLVQEASSPVTDAASAPNGVTAVATADRGIWVGQGVYLPFK